MGRKLASLLLIVFTSILLGFLLTPLTKSLLPELVREIGKGMYLLKDAKDQAAYSAILLTKEPLKEIPMPVMGVETYEVADTFGAPRGGDREHQGQDIFADRGTYVLSASEGIVVRVGFGRLGGNYVFVLAPGGERYYYAHLDSIDPYIEEGIRVTPYTILGTVGTTGNAEGTPPHLHFGIYGKGGAKNPYERLIGR